MKKNLKLSVNVTVQNIDAVTGKVIKEEKIHNQVVNNGLDRVADLIGNISDAGFGHMAIGTGATAETATDTSLETEFDRQAISPTDEGLGIIEYDKIFTVGSGTSEEITEAGLFDQLTVSGDTMFNRATFTAFTLDVDNPLRVIITINVTTS